MQFSKNKSFYLLILLYSISPLQGMLSSKITQKTKQIKPIMTPQKRLLLEKIKKYQSTKKITEIKKPSFFHGFLIGGMVLIIKLLPQHIKQIQIWLLFQKQIHLQLL